MLNTIQEALRDLRNERKKLDEYNNGFKVDVDAVKNYRKFEVEGISSMLTPEELDIFKQMKADIDFYQEEIEKIDNNINEIKNYKPAPITFTTSKGEKFTREKLALDYALENKIIDFKYLAKIFNGVEFYNIRGKLCKITHTSYRAPSDVFISISIGEESRTNMTLNRFLHLFEKKDFRIIDKDFVQKYLKPYSEAAAIKQELKKLEDDKKQNVEALEKIKNTPEYTYFEYLYNETKKDVARRYKDTSVVKVRDVAPDETDEDEKKKISRLGAKVTNIRNVWNSTLSPEEKASFMGWFCKHIRSLKIKTVAGGNSDFIISTVYPDDEYGEKYKEKPNTSGWDASSGVMQFDNITDVPKNITDVFKKLMPRDTINGNTLSSLSLVLFILDEYKNGYGFKTGVPNLHEKIDIEKLKKEKFGSFEQSFMKGYES